MNIEKEEPVNVDLGWITMGIAYFWVLLTSPDSVSMGFAYFWVLLTSSDSLLGAFAH